MYFVYAIFNERNKKFYIGQCTNLNERLKLHNDKTFKKSYTAKLGGSWILIYSEKAETRQKALLREKQLKSYRSREFIKTHIPG